MAEIKAGDAVEVRSSDGRWHRMTARSGPRRDQENAVNRQKVTFLSISVDSPSGAYDHPINWPAEDVRLVEDGDG